MADWMRFDGGWHHRLFHVSNVPSHSLAFSRGSPRDPSLNCFPSSVSVFLLLCWGCATRCLKNVRLSNKLPVGIPAHESSWRMRRFQNAKLKSKSSGKEGFGREGCGVTQLCDELSWTWWGRLEMFVGLFLWDYDCGSTPRLRNMENKQLPSFLLLFLHSIDPKCVKLTSFAGSSPSIFLLLNFI